MHTYIIIPRAQTHTHTQTHSPSKFDRISNDKSCVSISSTIYAFSQHNNLSFHVCNTIECNTMEYIFHCFLYLCLNFICMCEHMCMMCVCAHMHTSVCMHTCRCQTWISRVFSMTLHLIPLRQKFY